MHIAIVAGEKSGDLLAADLMRELINLIPEVKFSGVGGEKMSALGMENIDSIETLSVMGIVEVLSHLPSILKLKDNLIDYWDKNPPDLFIGVDAPDFNLKIENILHSKNIPTVHLVSPSIWAWRENRIKKIIKSVDLMLCLFPFETKVYEKHNMKAICVGHSMLDRLKPMAKEDACRKLGIVGADRKILGVFPGSRKSVIKKLLPIFLRVVNVMQVENPQLNALISISNNRYRTLIEDIVQKESVSRPEVILSSADSSLLMSASDALLLSSGTITLEAALLEKPMSVAYKIHFLSAIIARKLLKINRYSLPNLLAEKEIVREFIQENCVVEKIVVDCQELLNNQDKRSEQIREFRHIKDKLPKSPAYNAAKAIMEFMQTRK